MTNVLYELIYPRIIGNKKKSINGWNCFNGECCVHNGQPKKDVKKRAGIIYSENEFSYHCFNCSFKTRWIVGQELTKKNKKLLEWYGYDTSEISKLQFDLWRNRHNNIVLEKDDKESVIEFKERHFSPETDNILKLLKTGSTDPDFIDCVSYLDNRGFLHHLEKFYWESTNPRKIIIPFYFDEKLVGTITRTIDEVSKKYYKDVGANYIYNNHLLNSEYSTIFLVEGCFDAIAINGISVLGNNINSVHLEWIKSSNKNIIVVPDRDEAGLALCNVAEKNNWGVSFPIWEKDCKDAAEAVKRYGKFYTIYDILKNVFYGKEIALKSKQWIEGKS